MWAECAATLICFGIVGCWLKITELLPQWKVCSSRTSRKMVHIFTGPLYILCWNIYPRSSLSAKYFASIIPATIVIRFSLIGLGKRRSSCDSGGLVKDSDTVKSMSRTGNPRELLFGPLFYGLIFIVSGVVFWGHSPEVNELSLVTVKGIIALLLLCVGDGFAGLVGEHLGRHSLPWNSRKSWEGSVAFVALSLISSLLFVELFHQWEWFPMGAEGLTYPIAVTCLIAGIVESLPGVGDWDNVTVFVAALTSLKVLL